MIDQVKVRNIGRPAIKRVANMKVIQDRLPKDFVFIPKKSSMSDEFISRAPKLLHGLIMLVSLNSLVELWFEESNSYVSLEIFNKSNSLFQCVFNLELNV